MIRKIFFLLKRLVLWRIRITLKFLRAFAKHPVWVIGGAALGYLWLLVWAPWLMVGLEGLGVPYKDEHAMYVAVVVSLVSMHVGGLAGYRIAEERSS